MNETKFVLSTVLTATVVALLMLGILALFGHSVEQERDKFRHDCRARGGVPVIEREYKCMNPELFR